MNFAIRVKVAVDVIALVFVGKFSLV